MIIYIAGILNEFSGNDLSMYLDRGDGGLHVSGQVGQRMDTLEAHFYDKGRLIIVPERAEIIVYDANVDPRWRKPNPNQLSDASADFETGLGTWGAPVNATLAQSAAQAAHGTQSMSMTSVAAGDMSARAGTGVASYVKVTPAVGYTAMASLRSATVSRSVRIDLLWYDSTGALLSTTTGTPAATSTSVWTPMSTFAAAPAGASLASMTITVLATAAAGEVHYADMAQLSQGFLTFWQTSNYPIVDPPANPPFGPPALWTPRLFGGFCSSPDYSVAAGMERQVVLHAQDYTIRNKTTVCNKAYGVDGLHANGWTDDQIVRDLFNTYRPDFDTSNVQTAMAIGTFMPTISFPTHSLEQMLTRVQKISVGWYRIDYYKRVFYGGVGTGPGSQAPFFVNNDNPNPAMPTNLLSKDNSDFEASIGTWAPFTVAGQTTSMGLLFQTSAVVMQGTNALQFTGNANSAAGGTNGWGEFASAPLFTPPGGTIQSALTGSVVPVIPGQSYVTMIYSRAATATKPWTIANIFMDASGSILSLVVGPVVANSTSVWTQHTNTTVAPAGAAYMMMMVNTGGSAGGAGTATPVPVGEVHYFDQAGIFQATSPPSWSAGGVPSFGAGQMHYVPNWDGLFDRIWVIGGETTGQVTPDIPLTPTTGTYAGQQVFNLPARVNNITDATTVVTVGATTYTGGTYSGGNPLIGTLGKEGTLESLGTSVSPVLIGNTSPFTLALATAPPAGTVVKIRARFRYPLIQVYTDPNMLAAMGGTVFEKVLRDKRIVDQNLALQVAKQNIAAEGSSKKGGSCVVDQRGAGGYLLQPGQYITIVSSALFGGLLPNGANGGNFLITGLETSLTDDTVTPYTVTISFADRQDSNDEDIIDLLLGEQGRINAALDQGDINQTITDLQSILDAIGMAAETIAVASTSPHPALYDAATSVWGRFSYS